MSDVVADGADVIVVFNDNEHVFVQAKKGKYHSLKKGVRLALGQLIGREYGAYFDVSGAELRALTMAELNDVFQLLGVDRNDAAETPDNRDMRQDGSAQALDSDSIQQLKHAGAQAREIVGELVGNSKTFATRTVFSQQKYLAKKKRKYMPTIQLLRPTARTIAHAFYATEPKSVAFLREDSLAALLSGANVMAGSVVVVVGEHSGLLIGAVLERLNADARVLFLHCKGNKLPMPALNYFGKNMRRRVDVLPLGSRDAREWCETRGGATSLLIAGSFDPRETLFAALPLMLPSSNFAVHCRFPEPLSDCYWRLRRGAMACNLQLASSFTRVLQVLPNRTHPMMNMDGASGFTLTGITLSGGVDVDAVNDDLERQRAAAQVAAAATAPPVVVPATAASAEAAAEAAATTTTVETDVAAADADDGIEQAQKRARTDE